jgi:hypothetical protein
MSALDLLAMTFVSALATGSIALLVVSVVQTILVHP